MTSVKILDEKLYDTLMQELLTKRYQSYKDNPGSASSSEAFGQRINQKFGWND